MYKIIDKIKSISTDKKGESLIESMAALLIFSILLMSVTMMINTSLRITGNSTLAAAEKQNLENQAILEEYEHYEECTLTLSLAFDDGKTVELEGFPVRFSILKLPGSHHALFTSFAPKVVSSP